MASTLFDILISSQKGNSKKRRVEARKEAVTPWWSKITKILGVAGELGTLAMSLRDSPRPLDYFGAGIRTVEIGLKIRNEIKMHKSAPGANYFSVVESEEVWHTIQHDMTEFAKQFVMNAQIVQTHFSGVAGTWYPVVGYINDERIGWLEKDGKEQAGYGPYYVASRKEETYKAIGENLWRDAGANHCMYLKSKVVPEIFSIAGFKPSKSMLELKQRLESFKDRNISRSILLQGPPGSGKSSTARWIAREFGLTSLSVNMIDTLSTSFLETIMNAMKPGVIILDDLDRVSLGPSMLTFLENANMTCKLVIITTNCMDAMIGAAMRPGRIDDIMTLNRLDREWILSIVNNDEELCNMLEKLPVAYISEFIKRFNVLGAEIARNELPDLLTRAEYIEAKTEKEQEILKEMNVRYSQKSKGSFGVSAIDIDKNSSSSESTNDEDNSDDDHFDE